MKRILYSTLTLAALAFAATLTAQPNNAGITPEPKQNTAIVPVGREGRAQDRTAEVLKRAKENPGECDIAFIGDSITEGWEGAGREAWTNSYAKRKCLNLGVSGDRTQHVLWRFENAQLDGIKPKVVVLMIGTNNSNGADNTEAEILEGVQAILTQIKTRLPETKTVLVGIFPRGQTFSAQRGKNLQVNQALAKQADNKSVFYVDFGAKLIEKDGSISKEVMPDYLHLSPKGYEIWAKSTESVLKKLGV